MWTRRPFRPWMSWKARGVCDAMARLTRILMLVAVVLAAAWSPAYPKDGKGPGSKARQLLLKQALDKQISGTLVAELNRNKQVYDRLNPQQLRDLRAKVYMFKKEDPDRQVRIIEAGMEFLGLSPKHQDMYRRQAAWLKKVNASLTPQQRERLKRMTPRDRAKRMLELKAKLVPPPAPATNTTTPAK